jgi:NADPH:quinone reductase-like Zn-dependent oxidoreductase
MRAIVFDEHGGPEVLQIREPDAPRPGPDEVLIRVRAFGLNHADTYMHSDAAFPLSEIPLQEIVEKAERGELAAKPARVFAFDEIVEAHRLMDAGQSGGKLVVEVG